MCPSTAARLGLSTLLMTAALSACYVVPIDPRTGQPVPMTQPSSVTVVQPAVVPSAQPAFSTLQARLYPVNEQAQGAGMVIASILDQHSGRGSISLSYRGQLMQGDATYASGQVTLNCHRRPWMLVSTNNCVDTWTLPNPIQA